MNNWGANHGAISYGYLGLGRGALMLGFSSLARRPTG